MKIDTDKLTLKQKGYLVEKLTREIVAEMMTPEFKLRSERNRQRSGLIKVFGESTFVAHAALVHEYTEDLD